MPDTCKKKTHGRCKEPQKIYHPELLFVRVPFSHGVSKGRAEALLCCLRVGVIFLGVSSRDPRPVDEGVNKKEALYGRDNLE